MAVQENQEGKYVYKLDDKNIPQLTYIKVQGQSGETWIVKDGLKSGDKVIVDGILKVVPGAPVNIVKREELKVEKDKVNTGKKNK